MATLTKFIDGLRASAELTRDPNAPLNPTSDNCYFCPARLTCNAREKLVIDSVFVDIGTQVRKPIADQYLGTLYEVLPLMREWMKDVEARMVMALDNGKPVANSRGEHYKLVDGKKGHKAWLDEGMVISLCKEMGIKEDVVFSKSLVTPTQMSVHAAVRKSRKKDAPPPPPAAIGPVKWTRLQALITQPPGKAEVALESDPRPVRHTLEGAIGSFNDIKAAAPPVFDNEIDLFN